MLASVIDDSSDAALRLLAVEAQEALSGILEGTIEIKVSSEALRDISAKVKFFMKSTSQSPPRSQGGSPSGSSRSLQLPPQLSMAAQAAPADPRRHRPPESVISIGGALRAVGPAGGGRGSPSPPRAKSAGLLQTIFGGSSSSSSSGSGKSKKGAKGGSESSSSVIVGGVGVGGVGVAASAASSDQVRADTLRRQAAALSVEQAIDIVSYVVFHAKTVTVVGRAPSSVHDIDMSLLPDGSSTLVGSLKQTKRAIFQQYDTTVDLSEFVSLKKLTLRNCRVILLKGVSLVTELILVRSTILLPPSEVTRARDESIQRALSEEQDGRRGSRETSPSATPPASTVGALSNTSVATTAASASPPSAAAVAAVAAARASLTWDGLSQLEVLRAFECNTPLFPIPQDGVAMSGRRIRHMELIRSVDEAAFVFHRPFEAVANSTPLWQALTDLDLSDNHLERFDSSWALLTELQRINLSDNSITRFDEALRACEKLHTVVMRSNRLNDVSNANLCIPNVRHLDLSQNELSSVVGLSRLEHLRHLAINSNNLGFWSDIKILSEHCLNLDVLSFIDNPLCHHVFKDDISKLASALFFAKKGMKINGVLPTQLSSAHQIELLRKYEPVFKHSSLLAPVPPLSPFSDALHSYEPRRRELSPRRELHRVSSARSSHDGFVPIASNANLSQRSSAPHDSSLLLHAPTTGRSFDSAASAVSPSSLDAKTTARTTPQRRRVVVVKKRVKKTAVLLESQGKGQEQDGEADEGGEEGGNEAGGVSPDPHTPTRVRQPSEIARDEVTGDVADPRLLKLKYGDHWLEQYRRLVPAPTRPSFRSPLKVDTSAASDLHSDPASELHTAESTPMKPQPPSPPVEPKPTHFEPLPAEVFGRVVSPALRKFVERLIDYDCCAWRTRDGFVQYPQGVTWHTTIVTDASQDAEGSETGASGVEKPLIPEFQAASLSNPLMAYTGGNVWQMPVHPLRQTPEIWLLPNRSPVPLAPSRYNGMCLLRVDEFQYENGVGYVVRIKEIDDISRPVSFPRPALTSMHYCPAKTGRSQFANELEFPNVHIDGTKKFDHDGEIFSMTKAQMFKLTSIFSEPSAPQMICGFVLPSREAARELLRKIHRKFEDFRNPHYIPSPADWPLYQEPEIPAEVPLLCTGEELEIPASALAADVADVADEGDAKLDANLQARKNAALLRHLIGGVSLSGDASILAKQRMSAELRVQCDEMTMYLTSQLIPKERRHDDDDEAGDKAEAMEACRVIGTTWANVIDSATGREDSCFFIVLSTTICILKDGNWEGSEMPLEELFQPSLTFPVFQLEAVIIGFGFQYLCLDFGTGVPHVLLMLRDPSLTLRVVGHLKAVAEATVTFVVSPWPQECPLTDLLAGCAANGPPSAVNSGGSSHSETPNSAGATPKTAEQLLAASERAAQLPPLKPLPPAHSALSGMDEEREKALCGYFCVFAAPLVPSTSTAAVEDTVLSSFWGAGGGQAPPPVVTVSPAGGGGGGQQPQHQQDAPSMKRMHSAPKFLRQLLRGSTSSTGSAGSAESGPMKSPLSSSEPSSVGVFPPQPAAGQPHQPGSAPPHPSLAGNINLSTTFPLRHIVLPDMPVEWERLSIMLTASGSSLLIVDEEIHTWPFRVNTPTYATVLQTIDVHSIGWIEVTPPFSVFPLMVVLSYTPRSAGNAAAAGGGTCVEQLMICFQTRAALEQFVHRLDQCYQKVCGGGASLMRTQLRTAAYGHEENSPTTLMRMLMKGSQRRVGGGGMLAAPIVNSVAETNNSAKESLFVTSQRPM